MSHKKHLYIIFQEHRQDAYVLVQTAQIDTFVVFIACVYSAYKLTV